MHRRASSMGGRADVAAMLESHVNRRSMNKLMGILIRLAGEARRGEAWQDMMRGVDRAEASPTLSVPIIPQCNSKDISLLTTGDGHFPMKINMLYFPHTLENNALTHTQAHSHWREFEFE